MGMAKMSFDTHEVFTQFTKAGIKEKQAEAIVKAIKESSEDNFDKLATKEQLSNVESKLNQKIDNVEDKLSQKIDNVEERLSQKIDSSVNSLEIRLTRWMFASFITMLGMWATVMFKLFS